MAGMAEYAAKEMDIGVMSEPSMSEVPLEASAIFNLNRAQLVEQIDLNKSSLGEKMIELKAINKTNLNNIKDYPRRMEQNRHLLDFIERKPWWVFLKFRQALLDSGHQNLVEKWPPFDKEKHKTNDLSSEDETQTSSMTVNISHNNELSQEIFHQFQLGILNTMKDLNNCNTLKQKNEYLNFLQRLTNLGGKIRNVTAGSIVLEVTFSTVVGLDEFMHLHRFGEIKELLEEYIRCLAGQGREATDVDKLQVDVSTQYYEEYRHTMQNEEQTHREEMAMMFVENQKLRDKVKKLESKIETIKDRVKLKKLQKPTSPQAATMVVSSTRQEQPQLEFSTTREEAGLDYIPETVLGLPDHECLVGDRGGAVKLDKQGHMILKYNAYHSDLLVRGLFLHGETLFMLQGATISAVAPFDSWYAPHSSGTLKDQAMASTSKASDMTHYAVSDAKDIRAGLALEEDALILVDYERGSVLHYNMQDSDTKRLVRNLHKPRAISKIGELVDQLFFVTEMRGHRIVVYNAVWEPVRVIGQKGCGDGQLDLPHATVITPDKTLLVVDHYNRRISEFSLEGNFKQQLITSHLSNPVNISLQGKNLWIVYLNASIFRYALQQHL